MLGPIVFVLLVVWFVAMRWKNRKIRAVSKQMSSTFAKLPLVGHGHHFIGGGEVRMSVLQSFGKQAIDQDGWAALQLGLTFYGVVSDAEEIDYIMKYHLEKDDILKISRALIGNGLIFAPAAIWRPRRKVLAPTFSQHNLNQFVDVFYKQSLILADNLSQVANRETFSIWKYLTSYTMDSVCQTTLGIDMGVQKIADHEFLRAFKEYASIVAKRAFYPWLTGDRSFKYLSYFGSYTHQMKCIEVLKRFVFDIIGKKRLELKARESNDAPNNNEKTEKPSFVPILELLIQASGGEKGYTDNELQEESTVVLVAGTDTSAVGACFVMKLLAQNPRVQEKVYKEIYDVYGDSDSSIKAEDLTRLTYLEAVIKETMRLYPPVPVTARKIVKEGVTPRGLTLPVGMGIIISHWGVHRHPKYWGKDAEEFRPERFFDSPPTHPGAFIPFGSGPRNCLGYKYAMMSMMTATATLLRRFRILPPDNEEVGKPLRVSYEIMMKDVDDFSLKLEPRT